MPFLTEASHRLWPPWQVRNARKLPAEASGPGGGGAAGGGAARPPPDLLSGGVVTGAERARDEVAEMDAAFATLLVRSRGKEGVPWGAVGSHAPPHA